MIPSVSYELLFPILDSGLKLILTTCSEPQTNFCITHLSLLVYPSK